MRLNSHERASAAWMKVKAEIEERLAKARTELEHDRTEIETAKIRERIRTLKLLLTLEQEEKPISQ